jgi:hypothetical protein
VVGERDQQSAISAYAIGPPMSVLATTRFGSWLCKYDNLGDHFIWLLKNIVETTYVNFAGATFFGTNC